MKMRKCFVKISNAFRHKPMHAPPDGAHLGDAAEVEEQLRHGNACADDESARRDKVREASSFNSDKTKHTNNLASDKLKECNDKSTDSADKATDSTNTTAKSTKAIAKATHVDGNVNEVYAGRAGQARQLENLVEKKKKKDKSKYFMRSATSPSLGEQTPDKHTCADNAALLSTSDMGDIAVCRRSHECGGTGDNGNSARSSTRSSGRSSGIFRLFLGSGKKKKKTKHADSEYEKEGKNGKKHGADADEKVKKKYSLRDEKAPLAVMDQQQLEFDEDELKALPKVCNTSGNTRARGGGETDDIETQLLDKPDDKGAYNESNTHSSANAKSDNGDTPESETHRYRFSGNVDIMPNCRVDAKGTAGSIKRAKVQNERSYISEYKSFVENEKPNLIGTPFPETEAFNFEQVLNRKTSERHSSVHTAEARNDLAKCHAEIPKTPEEIEYEANMAAESADVMTPLPHNLTFTSGRKSLTMARPLASDIADMLRNLDANTLRINNMSVEEKIELMRRFEQPQQQEKEKQLHATIAHHPHHQNHHAHSAQQQQHNSLCRSNSSRNSLNPLRLAMENRIVLQGSTGGLTERPQAVGDGGHIGDSTCDSDDEHVEVVLRRKFIDYPGGEKMTISTCLYERRQPECPKLKLLVRSQQSDNRDEGSGEVGNVLDVRRGWE